LLHESNNLNFFILGGRHQKNEQRFKSGILTTHEPSTNTTTKIGDEEPKLNKKREECGGRVHDCVDIEGSFPTISLRCECGRGKTYLSL
jgi:hypothetical protein